MVSAEYQNFVYDVIEAQQDFNIKLIIFGGFIFYAFLFYYMTSRMSVQTFSQSIFFLFSKIYIYVTAFFLPLFTIMLFRDYQAIELWTLLLTMYGGVIVLVSLTLTVYGWQKVLNIFGIDYDIGIMQREQKREGE